jgi:pyridoxamine 5'-phosphate oxidase
MIVFLNNNTEEPFKIIKKKYEEAVSKNQNLVQAICISSYNKRENEISSRYVNLKYIDDNKFIFFTNYNSPKSQDFITHENIAAVFFWDSINTQIRFKAKISKTSPLFNAKYFKSRSRFKNALSISSKQSMPIDSYELVEKKYNEIFRNNDLIQCPEYWGGYSFVPYEIEIWEGNEFRLNKRNLYTKDNTSWNHFILEP